MKNNSLVQISHLGHANARKRKSVETSVVEMQFSNSRARNRQTDENQFQLSNFDSTSFASTG